MLRENGTEPNRYLLVSQGLTKQIRALEIELGVQLFERDKRPLQLTYAGQVFLKLAQLVLTQVEQATLLAQQAN